MSNLNLNFVFSYKAFGLRQTSSVSMPSTATWTEVKAYEMGIADWRSEFRSVRREWSRYAWPGGYPLYYTVADGGVLCSLCANKELSQTLDKHDRQFFIVGVEVNYENHDLYCDHCNAHIEAAYPPDEEEVRL